MKITKRILVIGAAAALLLTTGTTWADGRGGPGRHGDGQRYHQGRAPHNGPQFRHSAPYSRGPHYGPKYFGHRNHYHFGHHHRYARPYGKHYHGPHHRGPVYGGGYGRPHFWFGFSTGGR